MPSDDDSAPGVAYLVAEKERKRVQRYCTCELSRQQTCKHLLDITKVFVALGEQDAIEDLSRRFAGSFWFRLAEVFASASRIPLHRTKWGGSDNSGGAIEPRCEGGFSLFSDKNELLFQYFSREADRERLIERIGAGRHTESAVPDRFAVIKSLAMITLTPNERMLMENGAMTRKQLFEQTVWHRLAYHAFREFDPAGCTFHPKVEESSGTFFITCSDLSGELFRLACPREAVATILSVFRKHLPNQHGMEIHPLPLRSVFMVNMDTDLDLEIRPVIEVVQQEGENRFYEAEDLGKFRYGRLVYVRELGILAELEKSDGPARVFKAPRTLVLRESQVPAFIQEQGGDLRSPAFVACGKAATLRVFDRWDRVNISPQALERDWCWLSVSYGFGASEVSLQDLLDARKTGTRYVAVENGWVDAMSPELAFFPTLLEYPKKSSGAVCISRKDFFKLTATDAPVHIEGDSVAASALRASTGFSPLKPLPKLQGLRSSLRDYQKRGVEWLRFLYENCLGGLLCDDMGLGKTHQTMGFMVALRELEGIAGPFLVVCPTTVLSHWQRKVAEHAPMLNPVVYHGTTRDLEEAARDGNLVLTSYGVLRKDAEDFTGRFPLVVLDEIQNLKNPDTIAHGSAAGLEASMIVGLTGTPVENRLLELKSLLDLVVPGYLGSTANFTQTFLSSTHKEREPRPEETLRRLISPFVLRRKKESVLDELPEKIEDLRSCRLSDEQVKLYRDAVTMRGRSIFASLKDSTAPIPFMHIFSLLNLLKRICDHPALLNGNPETYMRHESGKWDLFRELLSESLAGGQKVVVFSQYLGMLDIMERHLISEGIGYVTLTGKSRDRGNILERFDKDSGCRVFLGSLKAGGSGIDLVAASVVIHYDRWWNAAREDQATDRVHRIGQRRGVQVFKLITEGTLEEKIAAMIERKRALLERVVVENDPGFLSSLSREDIIDLISFQPGEA